MGHLYIIKTLLLLMELFLVDLNLLVFFYNLPKLQITENKMKNLTLFTGLNKFVKYFQVYFLNEI